MSFDFEFSYIVHNNLGGQGPDAYDSRYDGVNGEDANGVNTGVIRWANVGAVYVPASSKLVYFSGYLDWRNARKACQDRGGDLASITSATDQAKALSLITGTKYTWTGYGHQTKAFDNCDNKWEVNGCGDDNEVCNVHTFRSLYPTSSHRLAAPSRPRGRLSALVLSADGPALEHRDSQDPSQWMWTDGTASDYRNWFGSEPDGPQECCGHLLRASQGAGWGNLGCSGQQSLVDGYMCRLPADASDSSMVHFDIVLSTTTSYTPFDSSLNGYKNNQFAQINLACDHEVTLRAKIQLSCATDPSCRVCEETGLTVDAKIMCYAAGCACYGTSVYNPAHCTASYQATYKAAYECDQMAGGIVLPPGALSVRILLSTLALAAILAQPPRIQSAC